MYSTIKLHDRKTNYLRLYSCYKSIFVMLVYREISIQRSPQDRENVLLYPNFALNTCVLSIQHVKIGSKYIFVLMRVRDIHFIYTTLAVFKVYYL